MSKGSDFERGVSKRLSLWWTSNHRDDVFWRTAGSGAWVTSRRKAGKSTSTNHGDLQAIDPEGQPFVDLFYIEMKRGYKYDTLQLLDSKRHSTCELYKFWSKLNAEADECGKLPLLILKRDMYEPMLAMRLATFRFLFGLRRASPPSVTVKFVGFVPMRIMPLDFFMAWMDRVVVIKALELWRARQCLSG